MKDPTAQRCRSEHAFNEGLELDITMVKRCRDGACELYLVGLETRDLSVVEPLA